MSRKTSKVKEKPKKEYTIAELQHLASAVVESAKRCNDAFRDVRSAEASARDAGLSVKIESTPSGFIVSVAVLQEIASDGGWL